VWPPLPDVPAWVMEVLPWQAEDLENQRRLAHVWGRRLQWQTLSDRSVLGQQPRSLANAFRLAKPQQDVQPCSLLLLVQSRSVVAVQQQGRRRLSWLPLVHLGVALERTKRPSPGAPRLLGWHGRVTCNRSTKFRCQRIRPVRLQQALRFRVVIAAAEQARRLHRVGDKNELTIWQAHGLPPAARARHSAAHQLRRARRSSSDKQLSQAVFSHDYKSCELIVPSSPARQCQRRQWHRRIQLGADASGPRRERGATACSWWHAFCCLPVRPSVYCSAGRRAVSTGCATHQSVQLGQLRDVSKTASNWH
jgi:hypothetical protein